jgi:hypothetical protein
MGVTFFMESLIAFLQDQWLVVLAVIVAVIIVIKVVKTIVKWLIALAIIALLVVYGMNYTEQFKELGGKMMEYAKGEASEQWSLSIQAFSDELISMTKAEAVERMLGDADKAAYEESEGTFTVTTDKIIIKGSIKDGQYGDQLEIKLNGQDIGITIQRNDALTAYIIKAKNNG